MTAAVRRHYEDSDEYTDKKIQKRIGKYLAESGDSEGKRCERPLCRQQFVQENVNDDDSESSEHELEQDE